MRTEYTSLGPSYYEIHGPASHTYEEEMKDTRTPSTKTSASARSAIENSYPEWFIRMKSGRIRRTLLNGQKTRR